MTYFRRILVTGADGFIGRNLVIRLQESAGTEVMHFVRGDSNEKLRELVLKADAIVHLAGENRPVNDESFALVNTKLTQDLCDAILPLSGIFHLFSPLQFKRVWIIHMEKVSLLRSKLLKLLLIKQTTFL